MGYHGKSISGIRYGLRRDEAICILSGAVAGEVWRLIAPARSRCTRIDLAVTVELAKADQYVASRAYAQSLELGQATASHIVNSAGGATTYVGSRTSRFFGRLYDKGAELGEQPYTSWRYEVECKKPASEAIVSALLDQKAPGKWISSYVFDWFSTRGIQPIFHAANAHDAIEISASISSVDKTFQWLTTQVRPTIGRLIIGGYEDEVREALQLPLTIKDDFRAQP
jgi:DNA relaxase NicK